MNGSWSSLDDLTAPPHTHTTQGTKMCSTFSLLCVGLGPMH